MSTPGRRRALKALGRRRALKALGKRRRTNLRRVARGEKPIVKSKNGKNKKVSPGSLGLSKAKAKKRLKALGE